RLPITGRSPAREFGQDLPLARQQCPVAFVQRLALGQRRFQRLPAVLHLPGQGRGQLLNQLQHTLLIGGQAELTQTTDTASGALAQLGQQAFDVRPRLRQPVRISRGQQSLLLFQQGQQRSTALAVRLDSPGQFGHQAFQVHRRYMPSTASASTSGSRDSLPSRIAWRISLTLFRSTSLASVSASATPLLWISGATGLRSADLATSDRAESERPTPELAGDIGDRLEIFMAWTTSHLRYRLKATSSAEIFKQKTNFRVSKAGFHHALLHHPGSD